MNGHIDLHSSPDVCSTPQADGLVFTSPGGAQLRQSNFRRRVWAPALAEVGLPGACFHDLRHTGNTLTAGAGANLRELMERMGHSSAQAAMVYLHATGERLARGCPAETAARR